MTVLEPELAGVSKPTRAPTKPLHVRVAEALGCRPLAEGAVPLWHCRCRHEEALYPHGAESTDGWVSSMLARYDSDWAASGPLIERLRIRLEPGPGPIWTAWEPGWPDRTLGGADLTPLKAFCRLILVLKHAGKLEALLASADQ